MIPGIALIKSEKNGYDYAKKICGLYPLERNIIILSESGIKSIYLELTDEEKSFYKSKIEKYLNKIKIKIILNSNPDIRTNYLQIPSNIFFQAHNIADIDRHFKQSGKMFRPILSRHQFLLLSDQDYGKAVSLEKSFIIGNAGYIARKINKRISIPISLFLVNFRIHPNYLTVFNMFIGVLSSISLLAGSYWYTVLGGFLFQTASVMDGVDGEVAKLTFKTSKFGSLLDTVSDNMTLLLFLSVLSYLYYINTGGLLSILVIAAIFAGIIIMIGAMFKYLKRHSKTASLVAYDKEFLQKLPQDDPFVFMTQKLKYITKKEFFSIAFFLICLTGKAFLVIPIIAIILLLSAFVLVMINARYLKTFDKKSSFQKGR